MDGAVGAAWRAFNAHPFTSHPMFEACWAVSVFVMSIAFFESLHTWRPGVVRHRLDGAPPVNAMRGFGPQLHKTVVPALTYLGSIVVWHKLRMGRRLFRIPAGGWTFGAPSFARVAIELSLGVFLYDLFFYPFHLAFHKLRLPAWRRLHARHHRWAATEGGGAAHNAVETVQNSYLDAGVQVFINICVQQLSFWGPKHPLSRMLHNFWVPHLLCEAHSGYDLPFMSHRVFPALFGGAPRHEAHHRAGGVYFHQFFKYIDDALGHTPEAHARRAAAARASRQREAAAAKSDETLAEAAKVALPLKLDAAEKLDKA